MGAGLICCGVGSRGTGMSSFEFADARSAKFKRRPPALSLLRWTGGGQPNHKRAQGVTMNSTSAWTAYRSAHTTLARWHLVAFWWRTRGQSKKRSEEGKGGGRAAREGPKGTCRETWVMAGAHKGTRICA